MNKLLTGFIGILALGFSGCQKLEDASVPTKTLMQGNWELTQASDSTGKDILQTVAFPVSAIQLTDDNGMMGTQGPMFTYIVYGGSKWIDASAKIKQIFDYVNFRFNSGEFFVASGTPDRFTVEAKLQATAAVGGLKDILTIFGVGNGFLEQTIYHKFIDVKVTFPTASADVMVWEFDSRTHAVYSYKDSQGNTAIWLGWPTGGFTKAKFTFTKRTHGLNEIVNEHK